MATTGKRRDFRVVMCVEQSCAHHIGMAECIVDAELSARDIYARHACRRRQAIADREDEAV